MKAYQDLLKHILKCGESHDDRTGVGTLSVFDGTVFFHDMRTGFPLITSKRVPFRWVAEELFWFLSGSTDEGALRAAGVDIWKEWATPEECAKFRREPGDLGPVYGWLWRHFGMRYHPVRYQRELGIQNSSAWGVDQIARLMCDIENNPNSRRHIVTGWDPESCDIVSLPPCHTLWQIKVHPNQYMSLHLYARSIDSFLGLPFNIASYGLLLSMIAYCTGYEPKYLIISFGDLHIYKNHLEQVELLLSREPRPLPVLEINDGDSRVGLAPLERLLSMRYTDLKLDGYDSWPKIEAEVAV